MHRPRAQDNVPAFDSAAAVAIVESGLGAPIGQLFESFDPVPIAAASLGQVHTAKVRRGALAEQKIWFLFCRYLRAPRGAVGRAPEKQTLAARAVKGPAALQL